FLANIEMAETTDQAEPVKLPRLFLEAADQEHLLIEVEQHGFVGLVPPILLELFLQAAKLELVGGIFRGFARGCAFFGRSLFGGGFGQVGPRCLTCALAHKHTGARLATPHHRTEPYGLNWPPISAKVRARLCTRRGG